MTDKHKHPHNKWQEMKPEESDPDLMDEVPQEEIKGALEHPSYENLETQLTAAEQRAQKFHDDLLRTQAEMQNIQRRARTDVENAHKYSIEKFAKELLEIIDNLERSLVGIENIPKEFENFKTGVELTHKMFINILAKFGIKQIDPVGQEFNPAFHEAMSMVASNDVAPNHIIQVFQKGYLLNERLIRPALVVVAKAE